jgi:hypothetical protein
MTALAKLLAIQERGCQVQALYMRPPGMVGVPAGEVLGGSGGVLFRIFLPHQAEVVCRRNIVKRRRDLEMKGVLRNLRESVHTGKTQRKLLLWFFNGR